MKRQITAFVLAFCICALLLGALSGYLHAQATASATVEGTVLDKTQAAMSGVKITLTSKATNEVRTTTSVEYGFYRFDLVPPGVYSVKATIPGFKTVVIDNLEVLVGRATTVNLILEPGELTQSVIVSEQAPIVDVEKTNVG